MTQQLLDTYCFLSENCLLCVLSIPHSQDIAMPLFLVSTEKLKGNTVYN